MLSFAFAAALFADPTPVEVVLPAQPAPLHGALLTPVRPASAVAVILPGSGPTDRDGNQAPAIRASTYRLLAENLAAQGIATLRIDKRGIGQSAAAGPDEADLRFDAYATDARAWAAEAARRTSLACAWLIGHSEGALVALKAVEGGDDSICGLVLLSGAGRPAGAVLREQLTSLPEPLKTQAFAALTELEAGRTVVDTPPALAALFRPSVQHYLISWLPLDPAVLLAAYDGPVLIGQGTTDIQIGVMDAQALAAADPQATLKLWDGVNHVLKASPADRAANVATYADPALPLAPAVAEDVADFIRANTP